MSLRDGLRAAVLWVLLAPSGAPAANPQGGAPDSFTAWFQAGNQAYAARNVSSAARAYYEAARLRGSDPAALYGVAVCSWLLGRTSTARAWAELSYVRGPSRADAYLLRRLKTPRELLDAQDALRDGNVAGALSLFRDASLASPESAWVWRGEAECLARAGRPEEAEDALRKAEILSPGHPDLPALRRGVEASVDAWLKGRDAAAWRTRRGVRSFRSGDFLQAEAEFSEVCRLAPGKAQNWFHLALARFRLQEWIGTRDALRRCLDLEPGHPGARFLQAQYMLRAGQREEACRTLDALAALGDAQGYGALAGRSLAGLSTPAGRGGWHAYLRLLSGPQFSVGNNGLSDTAAYCWQDQDYLRLSYDWAAAGPHPGGFAYSLYVLPTGGGGQPWILGQPFEIAELTQRLKGSGAWEGAGACSASVRGDGSTESYDSQSARLELDGKIWGLKPLALSVQGLREHFPTAPSYDADSLLGSLNATWIGANGKLLMLGLGGRLDCAQTDPDWSYDAVSGTLFSRIGLAPKWALACTAVFQPMAYGRWPQTGSLPQGGRLDLQGFVNPELSRDLGGGAALMSGIQWSATSSNVAEFSSRNVFPYAGITWSR